MDDLITAYKSGKKSFNLYGVDKIKIKDMKIEETIPSFILSDDDMKQYCNEYLYQFEKRLRKLFEAKINDETWVRSRHAKKYTFGMLVEQLFGRPYDYKIDKPTVAVSGMIAHYCSRVGKQYYDPKTRKVKNTNTYYLSVQRYKEVTPYSLKLQEEEVRKRGDVPNRFNVRRKKNMRAGQARNKNTQANMDKRKARGLKAYNDYKSKQKK